MLSRAARVVLMALGAALAAAGCARSLPDQDLRIVPAIAVAKLSTDDLWKDYQDNRTGADAKYWGKAVEVSGKVATVERTPVARILFGTPPDIRVRAQLLDEQAEALLGSVAEGQRVRLKCFCEGFKDGVVLKSCIKL